jgi:hypothetical protein
MSGLVRNNYILQLACAYKVVKQAILQAGFKGEILWQSKRSMQKLNERTFLREAAWVIFSGGMRESVVRQKFPGISLAFRSWESADAILDNSASCRDKALACFNHRGKVEAVIEVARRVASQGFGRFHEELQNRPLDFLLEFPYLGPATSRHLAKNLGVQVAKPDRHLQRVASVMGYNSPELMCQEIAAVVLDDVAIVDLVIWRYATLDKHYIQLFSMAREDVSASIEKTKYHYADQRPKSSYCREH